MGLSREQMLKRSYARDSACDGRFIMGVTSTGIYCLPSCPARNPKAENVVFFEREEEARAAGLRPCKRCRPDFFYRGFDRDAVLVAELRRRAYADPAAFRSVGALAKSGQVSLSRLHELCREQYHGTPLELLTAARMELARRWLQRGRESIGDIATAVGYGSLSAFNDAFKRAHALAPSEYRRLLHADHFTLTLPKPYALQAMLDSIGRDPHSPTERVEGRTILRAVWLDGQPALLRIGLTSTQADVQVEGASGPGVMADAHAIALRILGLTHDPRAFLRRVAQLGLTRLVRQRGLRIPLTADIFEALTWAIVGQQVGLGFAFALRRRLLELCGTPVAEGLSAHPRPQDVAALEYEQLTALQYSRRKAEYLIDTARLIASGALNLAALPTMTVPQVEQRLLAIRGLGPWAVNYVLLRGLGVADAVPLGDTGLTSALQRLFALEQRPDVAATLALMEQFRPQRSLATFHLWKSLTEPLQ